VSAGNLAPVSAAALPIYTPTEAARYAQTSPHSVVRWRSGYTYPTRLGPRRSGPVTGGSTQGLLTFEDLVEIAVVAAARKATVPMLNIRRAVDAARALYLVDRPLMLLEFKHDGRDLFIKEVAEGAHTEQRFVNLSRSGQVAWEHIQDVLSELEYEGKRAVRWYPAGRDEPVVIDPDVSFGRPYIVTKGISTDAVRSRFKAHESLAAIGDDLGLSEEEVEAALRFELPAAA
jgi:uncharacterized protein (DUF433 family)